MKLYRFQAVGLCSVLIASGCGDELTRGTLGKNNHALTQTVSRIPVPLATKNGNRSAWNRSLIDLMVADTWVTCSFLKNRAAPINHKLVEPGDEYLDKLMVQMDAAMKNWIADTSPPAGSTQRRWIDYRNDASYNQSRATGEPSSTGLQQLELSLYTLSLPDTESRFKAAEEQANESVALAAMNACIAQGVRSLSLSGDTLLLTESEQIQALEVVRERAQIAMLQYAALFHGIATAAAFPDADQANQYQNLAYLQRWAQVDPMRKDYYTAWVSDFSAMVQLHLTVTAELADLFVRSAAAKTPR
jgi:hypothetical protein